MTFIDNDDPLPGVWSPLFVDPVPFSIEPLLVPGGELDTIVVEIPKTELIEDEFPGIDALAIAGVDDGLPDEVWFWKIASGDCFDRVDNPMLVAFTVGYAEF